MYYCDDMRKIIIFLILLLPLKTNAISAQSYVVMDLDSKQVLEGSNIHEQKLIASITKIMTCIIAIENGNLSESITVDEDVLKTIGSSIYIEIGEKITLNDLLYGMMLRSGNDAALMIAKHVSGSMEKFATLMNEYAKKIGMNDTYFYNSHGLEEANGNANKSTAYDMALLTSYAMQNSTFRKIFATRKYIAETDRKTYSWINKNKLLKYNYINGGKTGYTLKAHRTLVTTGIMNNINIVIVTLNAHDDWQDHITLYNNVKKKYKRVNIVNKQDFRVLESSIFSNNQLYIKNDISVTILKKEEKKISVKYDLDVKKQYNNSNQVGVIEVFLNDKRLISEPIYLKKSKKRFHLKNFIKKIFA